MLKELKTILILYECSGTFTNLYKDMGYDVLTFDKQLDGTDCQLLELIKGKDIYGILAFPPCTHLSGSGARWWEQKGDEALKEALSLVDVVFRMIVLYKPRFWFIENPVGRLTRFIGKPKYTFNPNEFAKYSNDPRSEQYTKRTCLWGDFAIPEKKELPAVDGSKMWSQYGGKSQATKNARSKTPLGFAKAFTIFNN